MKNKHINLFVTAMFVVANLTSCGGGGSNPSSIKVTQSSNQVSGDLDSYLSVIPGEYGITTVALGNGKNELWLTLKLKVEQPIEEGMQLGDIRATIFNGSDMTIEGLGQFVMTRAMSSKTDITKVDEALKTGSGEVTVQLKYLEYGAANYESAIKMLSEQAKKFSLSASLL